MPNPMLLAFTLIEVILAVALSAAVLLAGFTAVRTAARTIANLNQVSRETAMLHSGVMAAIEDADFWNSEANPEFPYARAYNGFRNVDAAGARLADNADSQATGAPAYESANHGNNRRLFRRVDFTTGSAEDPNWMQPHDPRGWFRNGFLPNNRPIQVWPWPRAGVISYKSHSNNNLDSNWTVGATASIGIPPSWTPRNLGGDYADLANSGYDPSSSPEAAFRGSRARLMEGTFRELGPVGLSAYMPIGTMSWYLRPTTNLYGAPVGDNTRNFDKGEIPWTLDRPKFFSVGTAAAPNTTTWSEANDGNWMSTVEKTTENSQITAVRHFNRLNLIEGLPVGSAFYVRDHLMLEYNQAVMYGTRVSDEPTKPWAKVNASARRGYSQEVVGDDTYYRASGTSGESWLTGPGARDYSNETWLNPALPTSATSIGSADRSGLPTLRFWTYRFRWRGSDRCNHAVIVQDPETQRTVALSFSLLGSSYRGARQHWALATWGQRLSTTTHRLESSMLSSPAIGDNYVP